MPATPTTRIFLFAFLTLSESHRRQKSYSSMIRGPGPIPILFGGICKMMGTTQCVLQPSFKPFGSLGWIKASWEYKHSLGMSPKSRFPQQ